MSSIKKVRFGYAPAGVTSEYAEKTFHAEDGWKFEVLNQRTVRMIKGTEVVDVSNIPFEVVYSGKKRILTDEDFRRMNLPPEFWRPSLKRVPASVSGPVTNYLKQLHSMLADGLGLALSGPSGVGKTAIAGLIGIQARLEGQSVFFVTVSDLREMIRSRIAFDPTTSVLERCRDVGVLVLDNLRPEDAREHPFDAAALEGLLESRVQWKRPTFVTTRMDLKDFGATYRNAFELLRGRSAFLEVTGDNQRESEEQILLKRLGLEVMAPPDVSQHIALGPEKEVRLPPPAGARPDLPGRRKK